MSNHIHSLNLFTAAVSHAIPLPRDMHNVTPVRTQNLSLAGGLTLRLYIFIFILKILTIMSQAQLSHDTIFNCFYINTNITNIHSANLNHMV